MITKNSSDIVILTETKLENINRHLIKSIWSSISIAWTYIKASRSAGGIIILWDSLSQEAIEAIEGKFTISVNFKCSDGYNWWLSGVYGPASRRNRIDFWNELYLLKDFCGPNWMLGGDFNVYRWSHETTSTNPSRYCMGKFNSFIETANLSEPAHSNGVFTWSNLRSSPSMSKLDRFLHTEGWERKFKIHQVQRLNRIISDHYPILLLSDSLRWGPCPFKFDNRWLSHKYLNKEVELGWSYRQQQGHSGHVFMKNMKILSSKVKAWNIDTFKKEQNMMEEIVKNIAIIDDKENSQNITDIDLQQRIALKSDLLKLNLNEARKWSQLCKLKWLMEGDENTAYFHKICLARRRFNFISEIQDGQNIAQCSDSGIEKAFIDHFNEVFQNAPHEKWLIGNLNWRPITEAQATSLVLPFTEAEVLSKVNLLGNNKTPGPDGFTIEFFKKILEHFQWGHNEVVSRFFLEQNYQQGHEYYVYCSYPEKISLHKSF